jgi:hypothetical protein
MITHQNYHDIFSTIDFSKLPEALRKGHEFVKKVTNNGSHWDNYHSSETIKKTIDTYFEKLNEFVGKNKKADAIKPHAKHTGIKKSKEAKSAQPTHTHSHKPNIPEPHLVERIPEELRFIKRFVNLDGKTKTKEELLRFINSLQKAILEKKIRKTSQYAEQIKYIQNRLIDTYNRWVQKLLWN